LLGRSDLTTDRRIQKVLSNAQGAPVTAEAAAALISELENGLDISTYEEARSQFAQKIDKFSVGAQAEIHRFVEEDGPRHFAPDPILGLDPAVSKGDPNKPRDWTHKAGFTQVKYLPAPGTIYGSSISDDEPVQGNIGDCYLVAALSSIAELQPEFLRNALRLNSDGTVSATFYVRPTGTAPLEPVEVTVDCKLLMQDKQQLAATDSNSDVLWPALYEKMWARLKGSYAGTQHEDTPLDAMESVTGKPGEHRPIFADSDPGEVFALLKGALGSKNPTVACTYSNGEGPFSEAQPQSPVCFSHAYSVLGVDDNGGERTVTLRNPWGLKGPSDGTQIQGDILTLSLADFIRYFCMIDTVDLSN
jgi:hypothetical protein